MQTGGGISCIFSMKKNKHYCKEGPLMPDHHVPGYGQLPVFPINQIKHWRIFINAESRYICDLW